ncbi:MAG: hypothetical protein GF315_00175 [candidate division Zixibacteria bacterium]|nr:hypothetical protein [candidate division Zixibacteria bacterium]
MIIIGNFSDFSNIRTNRLDNNPSSFFLNFMQIIDLTTSYLDDFIDDGNRGKYESSFPELFNHYYKYYSKRDANIAVVEPDIIGIRKGWIEKFLKRLVAILREYRIDSDIFDLVYFIGTGGTNGHAFRHNGRMYVWAPLETYTSESLVQIFVTHEVAHAIHYYFSPDFYPDTVDDQIRMSRQLITEGLATYLTAKWLDIPDKDSLWADYLDEDEARSWIDKCEKETRNLLKVIHDNWHETEHKLEIFYASNPENIYQFRAGYYIGLRLIDEYTRLHDFTTMDTLKLSRKEIESGIYDLISKKLELQTLD